MARSVRILCLDVGRRRVGVALSDPLGLTAQGIAVLTRRNEEEDFKEIASLVSRHDVQEVVVGLPREMKGTLGEEARAMLSWIERLKERLDVPVIPYDERLSTVEAERVLLEADLSRKKRKGVIDKVAAAIILQGYLDKKTRQQ